jgi:8-oxo-dGTP diphosphatase
MKKERLKAILAVYLIVKEQDKILLYLRQNTGYCDGMYSLIAGHVEQGESLSEAMIREAKEEAGIEISPKNLKPLCSMYRLSDSERVDFFFQLVDWKGEIENREPEKCKELKFFDINNLPKNTIDYVIEALANSFQGISICEYGWDSSLTLKK